MVRQAQPPVHQLWVRTPLRTPEVPLPRSRRHRLRAQPHLQSRLHQSGRNTDKPIVLVSPIDAGSVAQLASGVCYNRRVLKEPLSAETDLTDLERIIGYTFRDRALLERAVTHRSWAHEQV